MTYHVTPVWRSLPTLCLRSHHFFRRHFLHHCHFTVCLCIPCASEVNLKLRSAIACTAIRGLAAERSPRSAVTQRYKVKTSQILSYTNTRLRTPSLLFSSLSVPTKTLRTWRHYVYAKNIPRSPKMRCLSSSTDSSMHCRYRTQICSSSVRTVRYRQIHLVASTRQAYCRLCRRMESRMIVRERR
jgi:hypothetical protein